MFIYCSSLILKLRGETGIRTPDTLLGYTRFPGVPLQPLEHLSFFRSAKIEQIFKNQQIFESTIYLIIPRDTSINRDYASDTPPIPHT